MHVALAVSSSSYDDGCPDDRAALGRTPCCWLVCVSDGRNEGTAAPAWPSEPSPQPGVSPHPKGNSPNVSPREVASRGMRELGWVRTRLLFMPSLTSPSPNQARRGVLGQG